MEDFFFIGKFLSLVGLEPGTSHKPSQPFTIRARPQGQPAWEICTTLIAS